MQWDEVRHSDHLGVIEQREVIIAEIFGRLHVPTRIMPFLGCALTF